MQLQMAKGSNTWTVSNSFLCTFTGSQRSSGIGTLKESTSLLQAFIDMFRLAIHSGVQHCSVSHGCKSQALLQDGPEGVRNNLVLVHLQGGEEAAAAS